MCGKIAITLTSMWDFHINNLFKFTYLFSTIILHEEN